MKLALTVFLASLVTASSKTISAKSAAKVLRSARRLEQNANNGQDNGYDFLASYELKLIGCKAGEEITDANGNTEYDAAIFRLCPTSGGCSNKSGGCKKGYGDFVVSLGTFVEAYFEDQKDNMNWDDQFQVDRYAQCDKYNAEQQDGGDNVEYFIGPTCTSDGLDVRLALFEDNTCTTESKTSFDTISNGWTLPFSTGGMVSTACLDCTQTNDAGEAALRDMCLNLYQGAVYACEAKMESSSYYGQNNDGCDKVQSSLPKSVKSGGNGGKVFGWLLFTLLIVGFAGYIVWWRKKKQQSGDGLVA